MRNVLRCYPDYGKAPPEYVASLMAVLETFPLEVIEELGNIRRGLPAKCKWLPVPADIVEMGEAIIKAKEPTEEQRRFKDLAARVQARLEGRPAINGPSPEWEMEKRKAVVIAELGYDPAKGRPEPPPRWLTHPDPKAPWRDKEKLAESAARLADFVGINKQ